MTAARISIENVKKEITELTARIINLNDGNELRYEGGIDSYDSGKSEVERQILQASYSGLPDYYNAISVCEQMLKYTLKPNQIEELSYYVEAVKSEVKKLEKKYQKKVPVVKKVSEDRPPPLPTLPPESPTSSSSSSSVSTPVSTTAASPLLPKPKKERSWFACSPCCGSADDVVSASSPRPGT